MDLSHLNLPEDLTNLIKDCLSVTMPKTREDLLNWSLGRASDETDWGLTNKDDKGIYEVKYDEINEAIVSKARNGIVVNFPDLLMRQRDPKALVVGDDKPTDQQTFQDRFNTPFDLTRTEALDWLKDQDLVLMPFYSGPDESKYGSVLVCPRESTFFAAILADLSGFLPDFPEDFVLNGCIMYLCPSFRNSHFDGKQVVVHNRLDGYHEIFAFNLYPGPSAKKGIFGTLLNIGENEGFAINHCSVTQISDDNGDVLNVMHEGPSGSGKSEMAKQPERLENGKLLLGKNSKTGETKELDMIAQSKTLHQIIDDNSSDPGLYADGKLSQVDAENGWFIRTDNITSYGKDLELEKLTSKPDKPLIFINYDVTPGETAMLWNPIEDAPGKPNKNSRVVIPKTLMKNVKNGPVNVDIRSFGVRCPPCTKENPTYGIIGMFHVLPPALAWIWRLVSPRGYSNPSIQDSKEGLQSEGVGSFWPFCAGKQVSQANLLLEQFRKSPNTKNILIPNQYIGVWQVGFMGEWLTRDYLSNTYNNEYADKILWEDGIIQSKCPLLGYNITEGINVVPNYLYDVEKQPEVGEEGFAKGSDILSEFFRKEIRKFRRPEMDKDGLKIIQACMDGAGVSEYQDLLQ